MKTFVFGFAALSLPFSGSAADANPVNKVIQLLTNLEAKIKAEGVEAHKVHEEFTAWCKTQSSDLTFAVQTGQKEKADLEANLVKLGASSESHQAKIADLAGSAATTEADLKAATAIRAKEHADFEQSEKELLDVIDTLGRAIVIIEKEMKGGASMMQLQRAGSVIDALNVMVQASSINSADATKLTALVQNSQNSDDAEDIIAAGAPAATVYKSHSGSIVETLEDLKSKAESQLAEARQTEATASRNFQMLQQSLEDEMKFNAQDLEASKSALTETQGQLTTDTADLKMTKDALAEDTAALENTKQDCQAKAAEFEAATNSRSEELEALAKARAVISEKTGGAESFSYGLTQTSFLQLSRSVLSSRGGLAKFEAVRKIRELAKSEHSLELAQLASRVASAMHAESSNGDDPFAKVKGLISEMISRLEDKASADATHKAYCDKELSESRAKKEAKLAELEKLSASIDTKTAKSAQLKREVAELQTSLGELAASQAAMTKLRAEEKDAFATNKRDLEDGIEGVRSALGVLREYYGGAETAHATAGESEGIIGLLEVIESDFSKNLAEITATEENAAVTYERVSKENEIEKAKKEKDVEYKNKEAEGLDRSLTELSSDKEGVQSEHDAIHSYLGELEKQCIAVPETYAERKAHRAAEIAGLKEALSILSEGEVLVQQKSRRNFLHMHSVA